MKKIFGRFVNLSGKTRQDINDALAFRAMSALTRAESQAEAIEKLHAAVSEILKPQHLTILLRDPLKAGYTSQHFSDEPPTYELFVPKDAEIAARLQETGDVLYGQDFEDNPAETHTLDQFDEGAATQLYCPIPGETGLLGWLILEQEQSPRKYSPAQIDLLRTIAWQFSLIIEKFRAERAAQKQLQGIKLVEDIASGINKCQDFDAFLVEVFEQINAHFTIDRFSLVLRSGETNRYQRQFLIENGKTVISSQQPLTLDGDFRESDVIKNRQSETITDNGTWFVTPLIARNHVIGAASFGHFPNGPIFDPADITLINTIAELLAGTVIKFEESWNIARQRQQISQMQDINRHLNTTFDLNQLLEYILEGAVEILNASSGILTVHSENTQVPDIQVTKGVIGKQISELGLQIRDGHSTGYYASGKSIILNQIDQERALFKDLKSLGLSKVKNLMVVPIAVRSKNVGSLELINTHNRHGFTQRDREILEGMASQAAIAIQRSAQSTVTNHDLENQIEELSKLQQITRGLNGTRDINRGLQITLETALIHTHAQSGTIGVIDEDFEMLEQIWQLVPDSRQWIQPSPVALHKLSWLNKSMGNLQILEDAELAKNLGIPDPFRWHYPVLSKITDEVFVLMILHLGQPDLLAPGDLAFLKELSEHARDPLMNALIFEDLQNAIHAKNEFISFISHELKNPLTVIKGYADILRKGMAGEVNEEQKDYLTTIAHNVRQMNTFIKDLSDQSQIETKSLRLAFECTPVFEVINEVLQTYEAQIAEKDIEIKEDIQKPDSKVWCDRLRLNQILSNLVSNALKYTPEGGKVEIGAEESTNIWDKDGAAEVVHFWVQDNGYGISEEDQMNLFQKFFRGTDPKIQNVPGSGLGLRISKSLVEMMGGQMWFDSTEGQGSTFHFTVPI